MRKFGYIILLFLSCVALSWAHDCSWEKYKEETISELPKIRGWCSKEKAETLMDCVLQHRPKVCVEIGTFGGSTTYPLARALMYANQGVMYAIDAWDNAVAIDGLDQSSACISYWSNINMQETYDQFVTMLTEKGLDGVCRPIRARSEKVVDRFADDSIDLLFVDGNFSPVGTIRDVLLYFPKVKKGGYIWLSDPMCQTKGTALSFLMKNCTWMKKLSLLPGWIVFKKDLEVPRRQEMLTQ